MEASPKVTVIPPRLSPVAHGKTLSKAKKRVAAYARVSTDNEEQITSYEAQIAYYTKHIKKNPD